ncbi:hypothetical protein DVH24_006406 [Malus domestica]|uniref:Uncharacterized protein n=1 Tax=Malus domestica TaxID=3750 RepID=A0A498KAA7_MALDO|nr:hypothetical protein DVH24_006406 [Malus domestica]
MSSRLARLRMARERIGEGSEENYRVRKGKDDGICWIESGEKKEGMNEGMETDEKVVEAEHSTMIDARAPIHCTKRWQFHK